MQETMPDKRGKPMQTRQRHTSLQRLGKLFDMGAVSGAFVGALLLSADSFAWSGLARILEFAIPLEHLLLFSSYAAGCLLVFHACGLYQSHRLSQVSQRAFEVLTAGTLITSLLVLAPLSVTILSQSFLMTFWCLLCGLLFVVREIALQVLSFARLRGRNLRNVVIVGEQTLATNLAEELRQDLSLGYHVLHSIDRQTDGNFATRLETFVDQNEGEAVDEVFVALPVGRYGPEVNAIVRLCEEQGIIVRIQTDLFTQNVARARVDELNGTPVVTIHAGLPDGWQTRFKRLVDMCGSFILLVLLAPLLACVAALIKLDSAGPVFFQQERVGLNRRRFPLFKFRTMVQDADQQQAALEHLNEAGGPVFKIKDDPRITPLGKFLRQFSIDELPQLVNVLRGDMSLVGPRPLPIRDVERIDTHWHNRRFSVKPGLTCLWQINGRSNVNFDRWVRMDLDYIDRWSLGLDLKILMKTVPVVLKGAGAY